MVTAPLGTHCARRNLAALALRLKIGSIRARSDNRLQIVSTYAAGTHEKSRVLAFALLHRGLVATKTNLRPRIQAIMRVSNALYVHK